MPTPPPDRYDVGTADTSTCVDPSDIRQKRADAVRLKRNGVGIESPPNPESIVQIAQFEPLKPPDSSVTFCTLAAHLATQWPPRRTGRTGAEPLQGIKDQVTAT